MLKTFLRRMFFLAALFPLQHLIAQTDRIQQLEAEMRAASGADRVEKLIRLSEANFEAGNYDKAEDWAEEAGDFAKRLRLPALRATALNREGKAMMLNGKRKASGRFEQSLDVLRSISSGDKGLAMDNLENLRNLAQRAGKSKDIAEINEQIARLNNTLVATVPIPPSAPVTRQELREEINNLQNEIARQQAKASGISVNTAEFEKRNQELQAQLAEREAQINQMTEEQMKTSMLLMQQRYMLDSVVFRSSLDSLSVANWNLALQKPKATEVLYRRDCRPVDAGLRFAVRFTAARRMPKCWKEKTK